MNIIYKHTEDQDQNALADHEKMASHALAAMLDELMGRGRNLAPSEQKSETRWDDTDVSILVFKQLVMHTCKWL